MNEVLREHVTSIGFALTLSKRMIDLLCALHHFRTHQKLFDWEHFGAGTNQVERRRRIKLFAHMVTTADSLRRRGLIGHYDLTKAGHLVVALLKEAGIYQERLAEMGITTNKQAAA